MKIVLTGGGSGGHITPILAVAGELKKLRSDVEVIFIGQRGDTLLDVPEKDPSIDKVFAVRAGKLRRYHGEGLKQLLDFPTVVKNVRDAGRVVIGIMQSYFLLGKIKPDCIFIKGGFVGVPVGLAAAKRHIPYITHDSDAMPGLANRIVARWAVLHAVALPREVYKYPQEKTVTVGVPVQANFHLVTPEQQTVYKKQIGLEEAGKCIFITGGGNGARSLNEEVAKSSVDLLRFYSDLVIVHVAGRALEASLSQIYTNLLNPEQRQRVIVKGFVTELYAYSGAADIIITRAGATNLAEFAVQGKPCIVVPNPLLAGGHQMKNAQYLAEQHAVVCVTDGELRKSATNKLGELIHQLFDNQEERKAMAQRFSAFARPDAAKELAVLLLKQASA